MSEVMCRIVTWDWKEQPDMTAIDAAMQQVYNGTNRPLIQEVPNTGSDQYAIIVSSAPTDPQAAWSRRFYGGDDWDDAAPFWQAEPLGREGLTE